MNSRLTFHRCYEIVQSINQIKIDVLIRYTRRGRHVIIVDLFFLLLIFLLIIYSFIFVGSDLFILSLDSSSSSNWIQTSVSI